MCIAAPGKIIRIEGHKAFVQYPHERRQVLVGDEKLNPGDMVLVQMGIVIQKLTPGEVKTSLQAWK